MKDAAVGWYTVQIRDAFDITKKPRGLRYDDFPAVPFVPMDLVPEGRMYFDDHILKTPETLTSGTYFEPGDALIPKITPSFENGKQGIIPALPTPFGLATTEVIPFRGRQGVSLTEYLFFYLLTPRVRTELAGRMEGTTGRQRLNKTTLLDYEIPLPPLPEQRAIARVLSAAQAARRREAGLVRERKAALMRHLFAKGTRGEPTKQTDIGEMPTSWEVAELGKLLCQSQYGLSLKGEEIGSVPILRMNNLANGRLLLRSLQFVELPEKELTKYRLTPGDVLFNRTNSHEHVGRTALFDGPGEFVFASYLIRLVTDEYRLSPAFLSHLFQWPATQDRLKSIATRAVSQSNISAGKLQRFTVPLPPLPEQWNAVEVLNAADEAIAALERESVLLDELFKALLEELMGGRLAVRGLVGDDA